MASNTFISNTMMSMIKCLICQNLNGLFQLAKSSLEQLASIKYCNDCNLEKLYSLNQSRTFLLRVDKPVKAFEIICQFAKKQHFDSPILLDSTVGLKEEEQLW